MKKVLMNVICFLIAATALLGIAVIVLVSAQNNALLTFAIGVATVLIASILCCQISTLRKVNA